MGWFKKKEKRAEQVEFESGLLQAILGGAGTISKTKALEIPTVQACISLIADKISALPIKLYEEINGEVTEIANDNRIKLLNGDTGDTLSASEMKKAWTIDYFLGKGAYSYIERNGVGEITGIFYVDEAYMSAIPDITDPIYKKYKLLVNGEAKYNYDFIKILRKSKGLGVGQSIISESNKILSIAYNTMVFENALVKKGGNKKGFFTSQSQQSDLSMKSVKEAYARMYSNSDDVADSVAVLNAGMDFKESSSTSVEMQLNENKVTNAAEICKLFLVPPEIISGKATENAKNLLIANCIMPLLNTIEAACDMDLLYERERGTRYFAFDMRELTRGNIQQRYAAYATALQNNFMQLDEVRELEDLKPLGFNYIKLGLQDVLLNPTTNQIYTPNTNAMTNLNQAAANLNGKDFNENEN